MQIHVAQPLTKIIIYCCILVQHLQNFKIFIDKVPSGRLKEIGYWSYARPYFQESFSFTLKLYVWKIVDSLEITIRNCILYSIGLFICDDLYNAIDVSLRCDFIPDCVNGNDERDCGTSIYNILTLNHCNHLLLASWLCETFLRSSVADPGFSYRGSAKYCAYSAHFEREAQSPLRPWSRPR